MYNLYLYIYICDIMWQDEEKLTYNTSYIFLYLLIYINLFDFVRVPIFSHTPSSCASRNSSSSWPSWPFWSSWTFWPLWSSWPSWPFWSSWASWPARTRRGLCILGTWPSVKLSWFMNDFLMHSSHSLGTVLGDSELASYIRNQKWLNDGIQPVSGWSGWPTKRWKGSFLPAAGDGGL